MSHFGIKRWDKAVSATLIIAVLGAIGTLGYFFTAPEIEEKFTEFYILGIEGKAENYPEELSVGEGGRLTIGLVNHEQETTPESLAPPDAGGRG